MSEWPEYPKKVGDVITRVLTGEDCKGEWVLLLAYAQLRHHTLAEQLLRVAGDSQGWRALGSRDEVAARLQELEEEIRAGGG